MLIAGSKSHYTELGSNTELKVSLFLYSPYLVRLRTWCSDLLCEVADLKTIAESLVTQTDLYHFSKLAATMDKTLQQVGLVVCQNIFLSQWPMQGTLSHHICFSISTTVRYS